MIVFDSPPPNIITPSADFVDVISVESELLLSYINQDFDITTHDFHNFPINSFDYLKEIKESLYN